MKVETVKIVDDNAPGGHVVINKSDFDAKKHEVFEEVSAAGMTVAELKDALDKAGIKYEAKASKADLQKLLDAAKPTA